jgi:hypothetical protein
MDPLKKFLEFHHFILRVIYDLYGRPLLLGTAEAFFQGESLEH